MPVLPIRTRTCLMASMLAALVFVSLASAAPTIAPGWTAENEPRFKPGSTAWHENNVTQSPIVYRTVVELDRAPQYVAGQARTPWYLYVYVDGKRVLERTAARNQQITEPIDIDLTPHLGQGRHVLAISATDHGFSLDLVVRFADGTEKHIATDTSWKVQKFPPLTFLWQQPWMKPDAEVAGWFPVRQADEAGVSVSSEQARQIATNLGSRRRAQEVSDNRWRLDILASRGIAIRDWEGRGFGGPGRLDPFIIQAARDTAAFEADPIYMTEALVAYVLVRDELEMFTHLARHYADRNANAATHATAARAIAQSAVDSARAAIEGKRWSSAQQTLEAALAQLASARQQLEAATGMYVNELNFAMANRVAWFDVNDILDNNPAAWGVRFNPVEIDWRMDLAGKWRFRLDVKNSGLEETVHTFGYNIENQWPQIDVPGAWEPQGFQQNNPNAVAQSPFPGVNVRTDGPYNGWAWYRKTLQVPAEWAGNDLELVLGVIDDWDWAYFNGHEVGSTGNVQNWWTRQRVYRIPKEHVFFGQYNVIAVRVYDCGAGGGIVSGPVELRCPALREAYEKRPQQKYTPSTVFSSPLAPSALIRTGENAITFWGWDQRRAAGPNALIMVLNGHVTSRPINAEGVVYDAARDGRLSENWLCLWTDIEKFPADDLPIQLVMQTQPTRIEVKRGAVGTAQVTLTFDRPGVWIQALRPIRSPTAASEATSAAVVDRLRLWSRAVLAYPVSYAQAAERNAADRWKLDITDMFSYQMLQDSWGTRPLKVALLPPLASFASKVNWPGLAIPQSVKPMGYDLGEFGQLMGVVDSDTINYTIPIDRILRLGGMTDFCFGAGDVGGPGNIAEIEIIKAYGGNSWRPQSNDGGQRIRRTVQWANERGLNLMINCDNAFGAQPGIVEHYRQLAQWAMDQDLPADAIAFDLINEPANMTPEVYNPVIKKITEAIRSVNKRHLIYVETPHSFASISQFINLEATGDPLTVYSFHDYDFRLPPRWPDEQRDARNMLRQWIPAFKFSIQHNAPIHLGEFGAFHQGRNDPWNNRCAITLLMDMFRIFDQFGWHFHYYSNRGEWRTLADGSLTGNLVHEAMKRYFDRGTFNYLLKDQITGVTRPR